MSLKCMFGHDWNGCVCRRCGKKRNEGHNWDGCVCRRCGEDRHEYRLVRESDDHNRQTYRCYRCMDMFEEITEQCSTCGGEGETLIFCK